MQSYQAIFYTLYERLSGLMLPPWQVGSIGDFSQEVAGGNNQPSDLAFSSPFRISDVAKGLIELSFLVSVMRGSSIVAQER